MDSVYEGMKKIRLTKKDADALYEAIDFISNAIDSADDQKHFHELLRRLNRIWLKIKV